MLVRPGSLCTLGGDGSSGCSLPVRGHPDSPHVASAAGRGWRGHLPGAGRRPGRPLSLPLQARHQLEDHPLVSPTVDHSCCWLMFGGCSGSLFIKSQVFCGCFVQEILISLPFIFNLWVKFHICGFKLDCLMPQDHPLCGCECGCGWFPFRGLAFLNCWRF